MSAAVHNLSGWVGTTLSRRVVLTNPKTGLAFDLTGWTVRGQLRAIDTDALAIDLEITLGAQGEFVFAVPATAVLIPSVTPNYYYDVEITKGVEAYVVVFGRAMFALNATR